MQVIFVSFNLLGIPVVVSLASLNAIVTTTILHAEPVCNNLAHLAEGLFKGIDLRVEVCQMITRILKIAWFILLFDYLDELFDCGFPFLLPLLVFRNLRCE